VSDLIIEHFVSKIKQFIEQIQTFFENQQKTMPRRAWSVI